MNGSISRPPVTGKKHHGGKSTALKGDMQGGEDFFADWQSAENEKARAYCGRLWGAVSELNSNDLLRCTDATKKMPIGNRCAAYVPSVWSA